MLVIRLRRIGRKHDPHYRIVVAEHTAPVQGKFIAEIGHYHPKSKQLVVDDKAMIEWIDKGAKPSNTISKLATRQKISHKHIVVKQNQPKVIEADQEATAAAETEKTPNESETQADEVSENVEPAEAEPSDEPTPAES